MSTIREEYANAKDLTTVPKVFCDCGKYESLCLKKCAVAVPADWGREGARGRKSKGMTPKKENITIGRRPEAQECIEGWFRVADSPPGRLLPDSISTSSERAGLAPAWDLYCWRIVVRAVGSVSKTIPTSLAWRILTHWGVNHSFTGFRLFNVVALARDDLVMQPSMADLAGVDLCIMVRCAFHELRKAIDDQIDKAEPFVEPARVEVV